MKPTATTTWVFEQQPGTCTGGPFTGAALNPARVLGPALVYDCYWATAFVYVFAELLGGILAALVFLPLYGFGQFGSMFDVRLFNILGLSVPSTLQQQVHCPSLNSSMVYACDVRATEKLR